MVVPGVDRAVGIDDVEVQVVDQDLGGAGGRGRISPAERDGQIQARPFLEGVGDGLVRGGEGLLEEFHLALLGHEALPKVDLAVAFHVVRPDVGDLLELCVLSGIERAGAGDQYGFDQRVVGNLDAAGFPKIFPDDDAASGRQRRRHGCSAGGIVVLVSFGAGLMAVAGSHDAVAGDDHVGLDAAVGAGAAAGEAGQTLVHAVMIVVLDGGAGNDGVLGGGLVVQPGGRVLGIIVVVAGGVADDEVLHVPHHLVLEAGAAAVIAAAAGAPAAVHNAGAVMINVGDVVFRAGQNAAAAASGAQNEEVGVGGHAAVLSVGHEALAGGAAGDVAAVRSGVIPAVVGAALVGHGSGGAADDPFLLEVGMDGGHVAGVAAGVLDADHFAFAPVTRDVHIFYVGELFRPSLVALGHGLLVLLDEAHFRHGGQSAGFTWSEHGFHGRLERAVRHHLVAAYSEFVHFLSDQWAVFVPDGAHDAERLLLA